MEELRGRVAVITGGGSGIGRATALAFAREGTIPVIADIDAERAADVDREARELGVEAAGVPCDVTSDDDFARLRDVTMERFGRVDIVMNNAASSPIGRPESLPMDAWRRSIDVNLLSVVRSLHVFLPLLLEQGSGHLVNTASTAGLYRVRIRAPAVHRDEVGGRRRVGGARPLPAARRESVSRCLCPGPVATNIGEQITFHDDVPINSPLDLEIIDPAVVGSDGRRRRTRRTPSSC